MWVNQSIGDESTNEGNAGPNSSNGLAKDYRTGCDINRVYAPGTAENPNSSTTWATHPAFGWGNTELNGLWVGKFETTGRINAPTVKPNQHANIYNTIGEFYTAAKSIGKSDQCNVGGSSVSSLTTNSHNLYATTSHMLKNSEWGAITYLAHSVYGAGINNDYTRKTNVNMNRALPDSGSDADGTASNYGITGCGPYSAGSTDSYSGGTPLDENAIESPTACNTNKSYAYNGSIGVLSSTTNNIYGPYGLSGGASEYVAGNRTSNDVFTESESSFFYYPTPTPYTDLYRSSDGFGTKLEWSLDTSEACYNVDVCTFETCGGSATHETNNGQFSRCSYSSWGGSMGNFVDGGRDGSTGADMPETLPPILQVSIQPVHSIRATIVVLLIQVTVVDRLC